MPIGREERFVGRDGEVKHGAHGARLKGRGVVVSLACSGELKNSSVRAQERKILPRISFQWNVEETLRDIYHSYNTTLEFCEDFIERVGSSGG